MDNDKAAAIPVAWPNGEIRLWDTQWMSCVNYDNRYRAWDKEEAIAHAVKMAERHMRENYEKSENQHHDANRLKVALALAPAKKVD